MWNGRQEGFVKDTAKWVIFPKTSYLNHARIERRNAELEGILSKRPYNRVVSVGQTGAPIAVAAGGTATNMSGKPQSSCGQNRETEKFPLKFLKSQHPSHFRPIWLANFLKSIRKF